MVYMCVCVWGGGVAVFVHRVRYLLQRGGSTPKKQMPSDRF